MKLFLKSMLVTMGFLISLFLMGVSFYQSWLQLGTERMLGIFMLTFLWIGVIWIMSK